MLTKPERRNYIDAIKCLHSKPALTPAGVAPGAKSRFDDFVVTHVLQTYSVHATVRLTCRISSKVKLLVLLS
jgi:tyrosinase